MIKLSFTGLMVAIAIGSCSVPDDTKDTIPLSKIEALDELSEVEAPDTDQKATSRVLAKASFTEPFMYAEFFEEKAVFTFPEKDTLVLIHHFDSLDFKNNFRLSLKQGANDFGLQLINTACIHPGSGEKWPMQAKFVINKVVYQGCATSM